MSTGLIIDPYLGVSLLPKVLTKFNCRVCSAAYQSDEPCATICSGCFFSTADEAEAAGVVLGTVEGDAAVIALALKNAGITA